MLRSLSIITHRKKLDELTLYTGTDNMIRVKDKSRFQYPYSILKETTDTLIF